MIETENHTTENKVPPEFQRKLSRDEINALPLQSYRGAIHVVRDRNSLLQAIAAIKQDTLLGFDTETRPAFKKGESYPPALLQLCGQQAVCIFQLQKIGLPKELTDILSNPAIVKTGVSVKDDVRELKTLRLFEPAGFLDLGEVAKKHGIQHHGLRGLTALLLHFRISKSRQCTNWARLDLDEKALSYAATDAWVGRQIYLSMKNISCI